MSLLLFALAKCDSTVLAVDNAATRAEIAERRLKWHSKDWAARETLVRARLELEDVDRAERTLKEWEKLAPKSEKVPHVMDLLRGHVAKKKGHFEEALLHWKNVLQKEPENVEALGATAEAEAAQNKWPDAIDAVSRLLLLDGYPSVDAHRVGYYVQRATWFLRIRDWAHAEADVRAANELNATHAGVKELLPLLESRSEWQPSLEILDQNVAAASSDGEKVSALLQRVVFFLKHAFPIQAFEDAKLAYDRMPGRMDALFWKGFCAWQSKQPQHVAPFQPKAKEYADWILSDPQLLHVRELGALEESEKQAEQLLRLKQPYMALQRIGEQDGSLAKVKALRLLGERVQARKAAQSALKRTPDSPEALIEMAEIEFENGNVTEALSAVDRILKSSQETFHTRAIALQQKALRSQGTP